MSSTAALVKENVDLKMQRDSLQSELAMWQRFACYCRSCALSGEHDPDEFETFAARQNSVKSE